MRKRKAIVTVRQLLQSTHYFVVVGVVVVDVAVVVDAGVLMFPS